MVLVIVNNGRVVKLRRANSQTVVSIGGGQQKFVTLQEGSDNILVGSRSWAKYCFLRTGIEATRKLLQCTVLHELLEIPVNGRGPAGHISTPVGIAWPQMLPELFELIHVHNVV